jgi:PHD/YefM family antitoxin component YafN of YafNO toxin-antitoxin module
MDSLSISQLKTHPSKAISQATDYPVAVESRNKVKAYLIGKELYEKIVCFIEDYIDKAAVKKTDFRKGKDFEEVAKELGI